MGNESRMQEGIAKQQEIVDNFSPRKKKTPAKTKRVSLHNSAKKLRPLGNISTNLVITRNTLRELRATRNMLTRSMKRSMKKKTKEIKQDVYNRLYEQSRTPR